MKARKGLKWLACALVGAASMVLLGCPHNNVIEHDVSGSGTTGRGTNGGAKLVITNFVSAGAGVNGPARTVAPEHIDLTKADKIEEYIFVASGVGDGGVYEPVIVDVVQGTGEVALAGLSNGRWDITVEAYSVAKLKAENPAWNLLDKTAIVADAKDDVKTDIVGHKSAAVVLSGQASLYLGGSTTQVKLTLTPSSEAKFGNVKVAIYFPDANDKATIFAQGASDYVVKARLVDPASYQTIMGGDLNDKTTEVELFDRKGGVGSIDRAVPGGAYEYKIYTPGTGYEDKRVDENAGKLLLYKPSDDPSNPDMADAYKIPAGKYVLLVTVQAPDGTIYQAIDPDFYVEGNRTTTGVLEIKNLLGTKPKAPTGFEVYYTKPTTTDARDGYDATFAWQPDDSDFSAVGYEIEIADITALYKNDGGNSQIDIDGTPGDNTGHQTFTGGAELWGDTRLTSPGMNGIRSNYVTSITWNNQANNGNYQFVKGTLLVGGGNSITLRLQTGHVYSARIRATNGAHSDWTYFTDFGANVAPATKFANAVTTGIFDLVAITYELKDVDMYTLTANRSADMLVVDDTLVKDLLQVYEYDTTSNATLSYGFTKGQMAVNIGEQVLVAKNDLTKKIVESWQGWQDKDNTAKMFGPVASQNTKDQWVYDGFTNLTLIPVGAGGSSLQIQVETADTTNVFSLATVGFTTDPIAVAPLPTSTVTGLNVYAQSARPGVYKNTAQTELVLVLDADNTDHTSRALATTDLRVAIGDSDKAGGVSDTLSDKNGNPITVKNLKVELKQGITTMRSSDTFTPAGTSTNPAYATFTNTGTGKLGGVARGKYTLYITMTTAGGYEQSIQIPVTILYRDMTANINNIP